MMIFLLTILSPLALTLAFPQFNFSVLAWVGLVPLMFALDYQSLKKCMSLGYLAGLVFFGVMIYWLGHVTILGTILFVLYLALYFMLFAVGYYVARHYPVVLKALFLAGFWTLLEMLRGWAFTGFGWAALGESQAAFLPLIQIADITGMYGVSFVIVFANVIVKECATYALRRHMPFLKLCSLVAVLVGMLSVVFIYGLSRMHADSFLPTVNVGVIQGNVAQQDKWRPYMWPELMQRQMDLTRRLVNEEELDLIVWPETAYPGVLWDDIDHFKELVVNVRDWQTPLVFGAAIDRNQQYFNSALFLDRDGALVDVYDKLHLVPFGEYVPFREWFPILTEIVPIGDFTSGEEYKVFDLPQKDVRFATLICFEDTVGYLARGFVRNGAQFLINITNDAWFKETKAPYLHLASSVFRAVENRRSLIRAANTGVSAHITPIGQVLGKIKTGRKATFVSGVKQYKVAIKDEITIYNRYPQFFTFFCFACILTGLIYSIITKNINKLFIKES